MPDEPIPVVERPVTPGPDPRLFSSDFAEYQRAKAGTPEAATPEPVKEDIPETPEKEPEPAEDSESADDTTEQDKEEEKPEAEPDEKGVKVKELIRLRRRAQAAERELEELRQRATQQPAKAENQEQAKDTASELDKPKRPRISDFSDLDQYEAALDKYEEKREAYSDAQRTAKAAQETEQRRQAEAQTKYTESENKFKAEHPDYEDVVSDIDDLSFGRAAVEAIVRSDAKAALTYELAKDRTIAERIATLSRSQNIADVLESVRMIGQVEGRISLPKTPAPKPQPVVSKAPPPGKPVGSKSGGPPPVDHLKAMYSTSDNRVYVMHRDAYNKQR